MTIQKTCWDKTWKGTNQFFILSWILNGLDITTYSVGIELTPWIGIWWHIFDHLGNSWIMRLLFHIKVLECTLYYMFAIFYSFKVSI
jgi:hypothetical protein